MIPATRNGENSLWKQDIICFGISLFGMLGAANISELGTMFSDNLLSILILSSLWIILSAMRQLLLSAWWIRLGIVIGAGLSEDKVPVREMKGSASPLDNDPKLVEAINPALTTLLGKDRVITDFPSVMGSEDFQEAFASTNTPYTFLLIGIADPTRFAAAKKAGRPFPFANHNNDFVVELAAIPLGTRINTVAALALLAK